MQNDLPRSTHAGKVDVFFLPFAGASHYSYNRFRRHLPDFVNMIPLELPGRGRRLAEALLTNMTDMVQDLFNELKRNLCRPYAIYGHSMGAALGYLLINKIEASKLPKPAHLFVSGRATLFTSQRRVKEIHSLSKEAFVAAVQAFGGIPEQVLKEKDLIDFFEPIIRADIQANETFKNNATGPIDVPITVMLGTEDKTTVHQDVKWPELTTRKALVKQFKGDHFFIFDHLPRISQILSLTLEEVAFSCEDRTQCPSR